LFPPGRFPRLVFAAALFFALLLVLDLAFVHSAAASVLASNSLDLAMVLLASVSAFFAASRSTGYARQLWLLLAIALSLETIGQGISTYYQSFVPGSAQSPWPSDVLFLVWAAPVFMIFLPRSDEDPTGIDSIRLLDFLQVAILAVTLYLYFFYAPSRWQSDQPALLRQILLVYLSRDLLLALAFFLRSRSTIPAWLRSFCLVLAATFLILAIADVEYLVAMVNTRIPAGWGDLIWMGPNLIIIFFALHWIQPPLTGLPSSPSRVASMLNAQILPIAMPLLVIFMGRAIAREQVMVAWLAVAASVLCSSIRLILTNRRQRHIADSLLTTERALRSSEEILSTAFRNSPDAFSINPFPNGPYLEINDGYTRLTGYPREEVLGKTPREMNLWVDFDQRDRILAALLDSGHARDFEFRFRTKSGLIRIGQMSASVVDIRGQLCSLVIVRDITVRKEAEEILRSSEERFRSLVRELYFAVVLHSPDAVVEFANQAAHRMFNIPEGTAVGKPLTALGIYAISEDGKPLPFADHPVPYVLRTRVPIRDALMAFRRPGSDRVLWIFGSAVPQFDANGNIIRVISSFADVTEMKNAERAIHNLSTQLLKLQDEERRRLGRELHDGLAQTVLAINLSLAQVRQSLTSQEEFAARSLEKARALTQQMSREIRTLSYLLHPPLLDDLGLVSALKEYVHGFSERSGIDTQLLALTDFHRLPQPLEIAFFRIVQESLANIQRHSGSATAEIRLSQQDSHVILEVIDFGHGMTLPPSNGGQGTRMRSVPVASDSEIRRRAQRDAPTAPSVLRQGTALALPSLEVRSEALAPEGDDDHRASSPQFADGKNQTVIPSGVFEASKPSSMEGLEEPLATPSSPRLGVGIPGMRERMAQLGGRLDIISGPTGTNVRATISLPPSNRTETSDAFSSHSDRG
jgi:PAS domain S-box-containing protein